MGTVHTLLVGISKGKKLIWRSRRRWEDNIETDVKDVVCEDVGWIQLIQDGFNGRLL
jgi:hypothetical protein